MSVSPRVAVLAGRGISKSYGSIAALRDVSLTLWEGRVVALVGENGAGKSTLVRLLSGVETADSGSLELDGKPVFFHNPGAAHEGGVRLVPQELTLCRNMSVAENISLGEFPRARGLVKRREMRKQAEARLAILGLTTLDVSRRVEHLSLVEQAFVQIARGLTPGARVLILDEPTAPMGQPEVDRLLAVLRSLKEQGLAILYISHRLGEIRQLADEVVVLRDGANVARFQSEQARPDAIIRAIVGDTPLEEGTARSRRVRKDTKPSLSVRGLAAGRVTSATLDVSAGEVVAVYGVLGSGREDLGAALVGAIRRRGGVVTVSGRDLTGRGPREAIGAGIGYVPAERRLQGLNLDASIGRNITVSMLGALSRFGVMRRREEEAVGAEWVKALQIRATSPRVRVRTLSGGSQQKVLIARWLAARSSVLLLEEPTRGVDVATKAEIYRLLHERAAAGAAVLICSSDLEEVSVVGHRVVIMQGGNTVTSLERPSQEAVAAAALSRAAVEQVQ